MEPAVGLGCILRSARRGREEDKEKQQHYIRTSEYTFSMVASQQDKTPPGRLKKRMKTTVVMFCFSKGHSPPLDKMAFKEIYNWI